MLGYKTVGFASSDHTFHGSSGLGLSVLIEVVGLLSSKLVVVSMPILLTEFGLGLSVLIVVVGLLSYNLSILVVVSFLYSLVKFAYKTRLVVETRAEIVTLVL